MSHQYHVRRAGRQSGPVTAEDLKALAAAGTLRPEDYVWREGLTEWIPAAKVKGLFPVVPSPVATNGDAPSTPGQPDVRTRVRARLEQFGGDLGLGWKPLLAALVGGAFLVLLLLTTVLPWYHEVWFDAALENSVTGLGTYQGKVIAFTAVVATAFLAVSLFGLRRLLPAGLLVAGAAATFAIIMLISYWGAVAGEMAEVAKADRLLGGGAGKFVRVELLFPFFVAVPVAITAAAAFIFASFHKPQELVFLENLGGGPWIQKHGALIGAQALSIFFGLVLFVVFLVS